MTLSFYEKSVYGRTLIYPDESFKDQLFLLTKTLTVTEEQLDSLHELGCEIELIQLPGKED
jgi:hypothetical protein